MLSKCLLSFSWKEKNPLTASGNENMVLWYSELNISVKQNEIKKIFVKIPCGMSSRTFTIEVQKIKINCKDTNSNEGK